MFDIGFWELALLAVIGLVVLGPERLPVVARNVGRWVARARHYMSALTSELEREVAAEDIRREVREAREKIEAETSGYREEATRARDSIVNPLAEDLNRDAAADPEPVDAAHEPEAAASESASAESASEAEHETSTTRQDGS